MTSSSEQPKENPPMICASFHRLSIVQPENCYNCVHRHGYPQYLFGDENCDSFIDTRSRPHPAPQEDGCKFRVAKMEAMYDNGYADGSRKAREDVLEELIKRLDEYVGSMEDAVVEMRNLRTINHTMNKIESFREVIGIIDSLRSTTQHTKQEQPR